MRSTSLWILALALVAGACSDDDRPVDPARISLRIVSGDRQVAPVAAAASASQAVVPAGLSLQQLPGNLLPEPLVARIVVDGEPVASRSRDPLGPSLVTLPSDVVVTYRVIQPTGVGQRHCGDSFVTSAKPDGQGMVTTYWERGTYAGECRMEVRLVVDGQPRVDTAFVVEFEPGAVDYLQVGNQRGLAPSYVSVGDTIDARIFVEIANDAHNNQIPLEVVEALPDSLVGWAWYDGVQWRDVPAQPTHSGWRVIVPDFAALGYELDYMGEYYPRLRLWVNGAAGTATLRSLPGSE